MSLKLNKSPISISGLTLILLLLSGSVFAESTVNHDFHINGFIAQGIIDVDGSDFVNDDGDLSAELTEIGLNASYKLSDKFRLTGQMVYLDGGNRYNDGVRVDYALLDWSVFNNEFWQINMYLGRYKNNHWLYSSTRDIPFARPSIILPQSIYFDGFRDIAVGADGGHLKASYSSDYLGDIDFNISRGTSHISDEQTQIVLSEFALGDMKQTYDIQMSVFWQPFLSSWRYGLSVLDSDFEYEASTTGDAFKNGDITLQRVIANAIYEGENWEFSGEIFQERFILDGLYYDGFAQDKKGQGAYVQTRYKVNNDLTLLARIERFYADKDDKSGDDFEAETGFPSYFGYQHDMVFGASYDLMETLRLQFEYHKFDGTARLTPVVLPNPVLNNQEHWDLWALQLMYWF